MALVSNSGRLRDEAAVRALCDAVLVRRNVGYDFGAMREGLSHWRLPRAETRSVLLVNDSLVGPFTPLEPILARADLSQADVWGATDSPQRSHHLQSFFLLAGREALTSQAWASFWGDVRPVLSKEWIIAKYEIGLTRRLKKGGLRLRALFPYETLVAGLAPFEGSERRRAQAARLRRVLRRGGKLNPTADLWRELLRAGFPFVKRELLGANPGQVADVQEWREEAGVELDDDWL